LGGEREKEFGQLWGRFEGRGIFFLEFSDKTTGDEGRILRIKDQKRKDSHFFGKRGEGAKEGGWVFPGQGGGSSVAVEGGRMDQSKGHPTTKNKKQMNAASGGKRGYKRGRSALKAHSPSATFKKGKSLAKISERGGSGGWEEKVEKKKKKEGGKEGKREFSNALVEVSIPPSCAMKGEARVEGR